MPDPQNRAIRYRDLAEECHNLARAATTKKIKEHYRQIAEHYIALAEGEEKFAAGRDQKGGTTPETPLPER